MYRSGEQIIKPQFHNTHLFISTYTIAKRATKHKCFSSKNSPTAFLYSSQLVTDNAIINALQAELSERYTNASTHNKMYTVAHNQQEYLRMQNITIQKWNTTYKKKQSNNPKRVRTCTHIVTWNQHQNSVSLTPQRNTSRTQIQTVQKSKKRKAHNTAQSRRQDKNSRKTSKRTSLMTQKRT